MIPPTVNPKNVSFGAVRPGTPVTRGVQVESLPSGALVTVHIDQPGSFFRVLAVTSFRWELQPVDPSELKPIHHGVPSAPQRKRKPSKDPGATERVSRQVGESNGITPLAVATGQWFAVQVTASSSTANASMETGTLVIQGSTWEEIRIPLSVLFGQIVSTPTPSTFRMSRGDTSIITLSVESIGGPDTDVSYALAGTYSAVGLSLMTPVPVHVSGGGRASSVLRVTAAPDAALGSHDLFIEQSAFDNAQNDHVQITVEVLPRGMLDAINAIDAKAANLGPAFTGPQSSDVEICDTRGVVDGFQQSFANCTIYFSPETGAHEVHGDILQKYGAIQAEGVDFGLPVTDETGAPDGIGRSSKFQRGVVCWTPAIGAHEVHGKILELWSVLGYERSYLGYPITDETDWSDRVLHIAGRESSFQRGKIVWTTAGGAVDVPDIHTPPSQAVVTPAGTALGGSVTFTLRSNGTYRIHYLLHDSGAPGYDFTVRAIFVASNGLSLVGQHSGHVGGTLTTGSRDDDFTDEGSNPFIQTCWEQIKAGTMYVTKDYSTTGVIGFVEDVAKAVLDVVVTVGGFTLGVVIWLGSEVGQLFGSGGLVLAGITGVAVGGVTNLMIKQRSLRPDEIAIIDKVFNGVLPTDRITLTNLVGLGGRPFTCPGADKRIYVNIGSEAYDNPTEHAGGAYPAKGEMLVHELTHAWQIEYRSFTPAVVCEGIVNQADHTFGQSVYAYGPPGSPWKSFGLEAQAAIVDQWFGGIPAVNAPLRTSKLPMDQSDPYFPYIRDNILAKVT
jgi:LGFP repeat